MLSHIATGGMGAVYKAYDHELRRLAAERRANGVEDALPERLEGVALPGRYAPYEMPGRLAIYGGLILFVMAGVIMYRSSPPPKTDLDDRE